MSYSYIIMAIERAAQAARVPSAEDGPRLHMQGRQPWPVHRLDNDARGCERNRHPAPKLFIIMINNGCFCPL